jgi:hypothetical protein
VAQSLGAGIISLKELVLGCIQHPILASAGHVITRLVSAARWIALDTSEHYVTVTLAPGVASAMGCRTRVVPLPLRYPTLVGFMGDVDAVPLAELATIFE